MKILFDINRKTFIYLLSGIFIIFFAILFSLLLNYREKRQPSYLYYDESAKIDYRVELKNNEFFEQDYLEQDNQYISNLIKDIVADFNYKANVAGEVEYDFKYDIVASLNIKDSETRKVLYKSTETLLEEKSGKKKGNLNINENIKIDFNKYNSFAREFIGTYNLKRGVPVLSIIMHVSLNGIDSNVPSTLSLDIPLNENTVSINQVNNLSSNEGVFVAVPPKASAGIVLLIFSIIFGILDIAALAVLITYIKESETDEDVYNSELKKILNKYESCISKVQEEFNMSGYKIIKMQSFVDLLEIRDTMRLPIIMLENKEKMITCFMITTDNNVLYFFSIGVTQYALPASPISPSNETETEPKHIQEVVNNEEVKVEQV